MAKILLSIGLALFLFQNCGQQVGFNQDVKSAGTGNDGGSPGGNGNPGGGGTPGDGDPIDINVINQTCDGGQQQVAIVSVDFPKPNQTCEWGQGGNLDPLNGFFQARIEQQKNLNLPAGAVICDADFNFVQQDFLYDDHFMLTFNNSIIAASYDFTSRLNTGSFGLLQYDWTKLAGMNWDSSQEQIFCPQIPGFVSSCSFPGHDQQGVINLSYDSAYIRGVMSNGIPENHFFRMVSIGDNDSMDCEHSDVSFNVTVRYVSP